MVLEGKRILLMAPDFYGYENRIITALEKEGLLVVEMDEQHTMLLKIC